jgi:putative flippase GtrA
MRGVTTFLSFVVCGSVAACANLGSRQLFSHWLPYPAAIVLAYLVGMLTGFLLFKFFVFNGAKSKRVVRETFWFIAVNAFALLQTLGISIGLADYVFPWLGMHFYPYDAAHCIGVAFPVITSFFGHNCLTFSKERQCN